MNSWELILNLSPSISNTQFNEGGLYRENPITKFIFRQSKLKTLIKKLIPISPGLKKAKIEGDKKFKEDTPEISEAAEDYLINCFSMRSRD